MMNGLDWSPNKVVIIRGTINHHLTNYLSFSQKVTQTTKLKFIIYKNDQIFNIH